jgi:predicted nucleic acid-binding protein
MRSLFVDTSAWCALYDRGDAGHGRVLASWEALREERARFVTSDYVLSETLTVVRFHAGLRLAVQLGEWVQQSSVVSLQRVTPTLWQDAWDIFRSYEDKGFSFVDCTSFALMRQLDLPEALALDHHFAQAGFMILPGPC